MDERLPVSPEQPLLLLDVHCPNCRASLTEGDQVVLQGHAVPTHQDGEVRLSALFGRREVRTDLALGDGDVVTYTCPACERSLTIDTPCRLCGAPLASVNLASGESMELCGRRGCRGDALGGYGDIDEMTDLLNRMFKIPHD
jgi:hypothetical protein